MLRQCEFVSGTTHTVGYVEEDPRLKPGVEVTLKDDDRRWKIISIGQSMPRTWLKRGWHNNI